MSLGAPMPLDFLISALVTLLVVVDPIGLVPSFIAITQGLPPKARRGVALRACLIAAAILAGAALVGDWLLRMLSITLPAFRIAGGLLLFSIASEMVFGVRVVRQSQQAEQAIEEHVRNIAAFPLAIPLMAGPGAITATVLLAGRTGGDPIRLGTARRHRRGDLLYRSISPAASYLAPPPLSPPAFSAGLAALAVQFVIDGCGRLLG